ncbi:hypothetical protein BS47DRAFT_1045907 [Hydnum rufescens UP504]|uniref:Uncharacterized protein n=1 Tax=Hydnum rufescens UP504 TaxID=1448309 RepID=A0A9P6AVA5_9AGAM|nr:hypothetical protein BS47DRAFT_1045907 [Hydnum rufescens UP504]
MAATHHDSNTGPSRGLLAMVHGTVLCISQNRLISRPRWTYLRTQTHIPNPTLGTTQLLLNSSSVYDPAIQERDEQTDPPQFADFVSLSSSSGQMTSPVVTTLASASKLTDKEVPSHKGKPQRSASRSQRPTKVKGGRHPDHTPQQGLLESNSGVTS